MTRTFSVVLCLLFLFCTQKQAFSEEDGNFNKQLMDVENEVNDLKERFFKSKATLRLLKESIVQGAVQGAKAKVRVRNKLGSGYVLDGNIQFSIDGIDFPTQGGDDVMLSEQKEYEILDKEIVKQRLLLAILGYGTNTGLKSVSAGSNNVSYSELQYIKDRYFDPDNLREAIRKMINYLLSIQVPEVWENCSTSLASDSTHFKASDQNLMSQFHPRYRNTGVMVYWHVDRNSICIYSQLKNHDH